MRPDFKIRTDGNGVTRYYVDGTQVDPDFYVARFWQTYGMAPTDPQISLTPRQEVDAAATTQEQPALGETNVFQNVQAWDAAHPAPATVPTADDRQLN